MLEMREENTSVTGMRMRQMRRNSVCEMRRKKLLLLQRLQRKLQGTQLKYNRRFFRPSSWNITMTAPTIQNLNQFRLKNTALAQNLRLPSRLGPEVGASLFYVAKLRFIPQNLNCMP